MFTLLNDLMITENDVKFICCNDSGESELLDSYRENGHNVKFEFSRPRTTKHNGKVNPKFPTFYAKDIIIN
jgi:hypothetical protein